MPVMALLGRGFYTATIRTVGFGLPLYLGTIGHILSQSTMAETISAVIFRSSLNSGSKGNTQTQAVAPDKRGLRDG
jgi:hypothetical protein